MYQTTWDTQKSPFHVGVNGAGFYRSPIHEEALARLDYLIQNFYRLGLLMGPSGSGKTALTAVFANAVTSQGCRVVNFSLLGMDRDEFVWRTSSELGETPRTMIRLVASGEEFRIVYRSITTNRFQQSSYWTMSMKPNKMYSTQ